MERANKAMNQAGFRKELVRIMPGYKWIVHRSDEPKKYQTATGIQTSGFNRLSTLQVARRETSCSVLYTVRSAGFGLCAPWLAECTGETLARALRCLQEHYEAMALTYRNHAMALQNARPKDVQAIDTLKVSIEG